MKNVLAILAAITLCVAPSALAVDDGQTQPKFNSASNNSSVTPTDLVPLTNGSGNAKGVLCAMTASSGNFTSPVVKFYVDGGAAQTITLDESLQPQATISGTTYGYTAMVPLNVRFASSLKVTIQKSGASGGSFTCGISWGLD